MSEQSAAHMTPGRPTPLQPSPSPPATSGVLALFGLAIAPACSLVALDNLSLAMQALAIASLCGGLVIFITHGGKRVTAAGVYSLTSGLMTGCGSWYWASHIPPQTSRESILTAALTVYASTGIMYLIFWRRSLYQLDHAPRRPEAIPPRLAAGTATLGILLFVAGAAAKTSGVALGTMPQSTAEVGVVLFASSLLLSGGVRILRSPFRTLAVMAALVAFYLTVFSGGGRLRLAALVVAIAVISQYRLLTPIKAIAVVALVPTILLFGYIGEARVATLTNDPAAEASASGLGSLVNPLTTYAQLIDQHVTVGNPSTFLAEAVVPVPRELWPHKPVQFGAVVVRELRPAQVDTGLSMPCLAQCEWYYDFSWSGVILMIAVIGWLVRAVDQAAARRSRRRIEGAHSLFVYVFFATLLGSISDLAWGGTSTWESRNVQRMLVLLPFIAWAYLAPLRQDRPDGQIDAMDHRDGFLDPKIWSRSHKDE